MLPYIITSILFDYRQTGELKPEYIFSWLTYLNPSYKGVSLFLSDHCRLAFRKPQWRERFFLSLTSAALEIFPTVKAGHEDWVHVSILRRGCASRVTGHVPGKKGIRVHCIGEEKASSPGSIDMGEPLLTYIGICWSRMPCTCTYEATQISNKQLGRVLWFLISCNFGFPRAYHYNSHNSTKAGQEPSSHGKRDYTVCDGPALHPRHSMIVQRATE